MLRNPGSRTLEIVAGTAATTAVGMIPLHRLPKAVQGGYVLLPAALTSGLLLRAARRRDVSTVAGPESSPRTPRVGPWRPSVRVAALCMTPGVLVAGAGAGSILLDRGIENLLRRRGIIAPRVWMGLAAGTLSLVLDVLGDRMSDPEEDMDDGDDDLTSPPSAP